MKNKIFYISILVIVFAGFFAFGMIINQPKYLHQKQAQTLEREPKKIADEVLTFDMVASSKNNEYKGKPVNWQGMINTSASQIDGIKFYILDSEHSVHSWKQSDWFWAIPNDNGGANNGDWVSYMLKRYGTVKGAVDKGGNSGSSFYDPEGGVKDSGIDPEKQIFEIRGSVHENDCDFMFNDDKIHCIPNIEVESIKKL